MTNKVTVCHNGHEINISINALEAHMGHGDSNGECTEEENPENEERDSGTSYDSGTDGDGGDNNNSDRDSGFDDSGYQDAGIDSGSPVLWEIDAGTGTVIDAGTESIFVPVGCTCEATGLLDVTLFSTLILGSLFLFKKIKF